MKVHELGFIWLLTIALIAGCTSPDEQGESDGGTVVTDLGPGQPDQAVDPEPELEPITALKVAAVQYSQGDYSHAAKGCNDDVCALSAYIRAAARKKARIVVLPEGAADQEYLELTPKVGDNPGEDPKWKESPVLSTFSRLSDELNITVIVHLLTQDGLDESAKLFSTSVALDRYGKAVAVHHKYELFGEKGLTPGTNINTSFFDTPAGKAGLLICADVHCIVTKYQKGENICLTQQQVAMTQAFLNQKPDVIFFSAMWFIPWYQDGWGSIPVQETVAKNTLTYLVAANNTQSEGYGGGIYGPDGEPLVLDGKEALVHDTTPTIVYAELPLKK
jgi:predicted amidohydrolase